MENSLGGQERNDSLQNDNETGRLSSQPPLISFKRDKNIGNFLVRSVLKSDDQPGTFKCARKRCNTCPFIHNPDKITPSDGLKSLIALHVPPQQMTICGLSLHQGNTESRKNLEKNSFFKSAHLIPMVSTNAFHSTNLFLFFTLPCSYQ